MEKKRIKITSAYVRAGETNIHYLTGGEGKPIVFVHGWPTSSRLYRNVLPRLAETHRVLAPDFPGFGQSDKPEDVRYTHGYHAQCIERFLTALAIPKTSLVLHDVGVPIGLLWAVRNPGRAERVVILNSLFDPDGAAGLFYRRPVSWLERNRILFMHREASALIKFMLLMVYTPLLRRLIFSAFGISRIFHAGVGNRAVLSKEVISGYQMPFAGKGGAKILTRTFFDPHLDELREITDNIKRLTMPVHILYGSEDKVLPGLAREMEKLKDDLPDARLTALPGCGHYLQEDNPDEVNRIISRFMRGE